MVEVRTLKKSIDKLKKEVYKDSKCLEPYSLDYQKDVSTPIVTKKEIRDAIRFLDRAKRKLKKVLNRP